METNHWPVSMWRMNVESITVDDDDDDDDDDNWNTHKNTNNNNTITDLAYDSKGSYM